MATIYPVDFSASGTSGLFGQTPLLITFTDTNIVRGGYPRIWNFGDGTILNFPSRVATVQHTYTTTQRCTVSLTLTGYNLPGYPNPKIKTDLILPFNYNFYDNGYINKCFSLYNESYTTPIIRNNVSYNTLNINALPYNILGTQYLEIEFYLNLDTSGHIGFNLGVGNRRIVFYNNYVALNYSNQIYTLSISGWKKIKIKYDHGRWYMYLDDVLQTPDSYVDSTISTTLSLISFYSMVDDSASHNGIYSTLIDEILVKPSNG